MPRGMIGGSEGGHGAATMPMTLRRTWISRVLLFSGFILLGAPHGAWAAPGELDRTFGKDGIAVTPGSAGCGGVAEIKSLSGGRYLTAGLSTRTDRSSTATWTATMTSSFRGRHRISVTARDTSGNKRVAIKRFRARCAPAR